MTGLLKSALQRIALLPECEQDAIASRILEALEEEELRRLQFEISSGGMHRPAARMLIDTTARPAR